MYRACWSLCHHWRHYTERG